MNTFKPSAINRQACEWIAKMHDDELSEEEYARFKAWMSKSPEHRAEIRRMAQRWDELNVLTLLGVPSEREKPLKLSNRHFVNSGLKMGMVAAAFFVMAIFMWPQAPIGVSGVSSVQSYSTAIGEQRKVILPDNSTVLLNTQSQFNIAYTGAYRDIYLVQGEAHFEVLPNVARPFRVFAGKSKVRAVGTAFSVYLKKQTVEVTVTDGSVEIDSIRELIEDNSYVTGIENSKNSSIVHAGQAAEFDQLEGTVETKTLPENAHIPSWHHGELKFSGEPLEQVVEEISRYTPLSIVILDSELRDLRVGGRFTVGETQKMLEALEGGFGINVEYINVNLVHLTSED